MKSNAVPLEKLVNTILLFSPGNIARVQEVLDKLVPASTQYRLEIKDDLHVVFYNNCKGEMDLRTFTY